MSASLNAGSVVATAGQKVNVASLLQISGNNPTYLVVSLLDRKEYTASSNGNTGVLSDNGHTTGFGYLSGDSYTVGIVFTFNASTGQYTNATYGNLANLTYTASTNTNDNTSLSVFTTNNSSIASNYANNPYTLEFYVGTYTSYVGSISVVTEPAFVGPTPNQATPSSICSVAMNFVGKTWNLNGCWVLTSDISAEAGASLPITSTMLGTPGVASGEWIVAYNGPAGQSGSWQSQITAGEMVLFKTSATSGHITTVVSGAGSSAMVVDNAYFVNSSGQIVNSAQDGSANDIIIAGPHLASQEWALAVTGSVVVYELNCPIITANSAGSDLAVGKLEPLSLLFTASNPNKSTAITNYQFYDCGSGGAIDSFMVGGIDCVSQSAATAITVSASALSSINLLAGSSAGTDSISIRAFNGFYWGDWTTLTVNINVTTPAATQSLFSASDTPAKSYNDGKQVEVGVKFTSSVAGSITGIEFYRAAGDTGPDIAQLWSSTGTLLASGTFSNTSASGWQTVTFSSPVAITAGTTYVASYHSTGAYAATSNYFTSAHTNGSLTALSSTASGGNGVYAYGGTSTTGLLPTNSYQASNYFVDVVFNSGAANLPPVANADSGFVTPENAPLTIATSSLLANDTDPQSYALSVTSVAPIAGTTQGTVSLSGSTITYTPASATFTGADSFGYTISDGHGGTASAVVALDVTTPAATQSLFSASDTPAKSYNDGKQVEVGVKFTSSVAGSITGIEFYRAAGDTGPDIAQLWSSTGTLLASGTFSNTSASGWQTVTFSSPVAITAGTTYVASYHSTGAYAATSNYFTSAHTNGSLTALLSTASGGNGVYAYGGTSTTGLLPTNSYQASNYWVDVVFNPQLTSGSPSAVSIKATPIAGIVQHALDKELGLPP